ncbi:glycoside hydrolase family 5 protein [Amanita thiersii Skay4041]|uniref:mannan endo-1,4-beta-mannosidase n=1 Tax=Amanita thiersii Skay4041 TaxID=703135 RepID=A0A2A9P037_9AGAR|nr:glycoside hydrolase family 5 protein [Amanita thiersii Skay4041]
MRVPLLGLLTALLLTFQLTAAKQIYRQPTKTRRNNGPAKEFVTLASDGRFMFNGSEFPLIATTAYWLPALNSVDDIDHTLANISAAGFNTVRIWAFNDVSTIPENGTWFQLIANGTTTINNGTNGLQKLDQVVQLAEKHKLFLLMSLTNNWNPQPTDSIVDSPIGFSARDVTNTTTRSRNVLSNDYGGMDAYVRGLGGAQEHDQFFRNETLIGAYKNYTTHIVTRYKNSPRILSWEIANDPRCNSSIPTSQMCDTSTVTFWHSNIAMHIKSQDPNHLVSSGHQGFFCPDCPKHFQRPTPPPQVSASPGVRRSIPKPLTKASLLKERKAWLKKARQVELAKRKPTEGGIRVRGRWTATSTTKRQDIGLGPAFDGSPGVDSEDIINIPQVDFGSFQLFPDQNTYGIPVDPTLPAFNQTLETGLGWIQKQAQAAQRNGKPIVMVGFGLVTQERSQSFVPFNSTQASFGPSQGSQGPSQQTFGVTDSQRDDAYSQWMLGALRSGITGVIHYQWGQGNLTVQQGTAVSTGSDQTGTTTGNDQTGFSPEDGYSVQGVGQPDFVQVVQQTTQTFGPA